MYKKGTDIAIADSLSQVTPMDPEDNIKLPIIVVNMITTQILMSVESQGRFSSKLELLIKSTVQDEQLKDSKVTLAQDSCVTRRTCQQIFMSFGHTRKRYPLNQDSLLVGIES